MKTCIGLFGTCGKSTWRRAFIECFEARGMKDGIDFFNPQVEDWSPVMAKAEARHLAEDSVICVPVTGGSYSLGSLAETGFSIIQAMRLDDRRDFIVLIDQYLDDELMENEKLARESLHIRALVSQHLEMLRLASVYIVNTLDEMLEVSLACFGAHKMLEESRRRWNPHE